MSKPSRLKQRLLAGLICSLMVHQSVALDTATITSSVLSPDCFEYRISGICYWLQCTLTGCKVRTSVKVSHYVPDAVVSSYATTGQNPWAEMSFLGIPNPMAEDGGEGTINHGRENNIERFKEADVIGHPGGILFNEFASSFGKICEGAGTPLMPYFVSTLDFLAWRQNIPELAYPEALIPGMREVGTPFVNTWGHIYPRGGFLQQTDDHHAAAVVAQRAGDVVTRTMQPHVYLPLLANKKDGYWPAGELIESDRSTGKWQELTPKLSMSCNVFPNNNYLIQAIGGGYAWALWRPYSCCERKGQIFLGSTSF